MQQVSEAGLEDRAAWEAMWRANCAHHGAAAMTDAVIDGLWQRILDPDFPMHAAIARDASGAALGLAHYILHPHTFTLRPVCYLEDLWVAADARGQGIGGVLIGHLEARGRAEGWRRIYWVSEPDNAAAIALYQRVARRTDYVQFRIDLGR
ncbi:acetyltransferase (GNAT) family protein [Stella humosa]|uniref:Acetyltransferase (GNAT) family protein n=1 Tax=Stella humosa TaxID=94 RepID=A0A3N1L4A0_9PROT|nr:GNAT family N-acetyltransferase [Stella humosa]ROP84235.1 acetyltransferase (GNAT) family protein [Stella humosa]BBK33747.1 N-acetyltransferase [Stella humosa]